MAICVAILAFVGAALGARSCEGEIRSAGEALAWIAGGAVLGAAFGVFATLLSGAPDSPVRFNTPDVSLAAKVGGLAFVGAVCGYLPDWGKNLKPLGERVTSAFLGSSEDGTPANTRLLFAVVGAFVGPLLASVRER